MRLPRYDDWKAGSNNLSGRDRLPESSFVSAINLDPSIGGKLGLRAQFEIVRPCSDARGLFACGRLLVLVSGDQLIAFDPLTDGSTLLATIANRGAIAATYLNGSLYLNTITDSLRFNGKAILAWAVPAPMATVAIVPGRLPAGVYKIAVTAIAAEVESGATPFIAVLDGTQGISVACTDARECRVYSSVADGQTLYDQGALQAGAMGLDYVSDSGARLQTAGLESLPFCDLLSTHQAMILGSRGQTLYHSEPMLAHLYSPTKGFIQFDCDIAMHASVGAGVFVATAEKTYFITGIGTPDVYQREVLDFGAVEGTAVTLPGGQACWFTAYGQAIGSPDGSVSLPNRTTFSPDTASIGASGLLEYNGNQMVVTSMRGETKGNSLRAGDFADLEIINNV